MNAIPSSCLLLLTASLAVAQTPATPAAAPATAPAADPWKNLRLGSAEGPTLSLGGRLRARTEHWENFGLAAPNDDDFQLYRAFLNADLRLGPSLRVFAEAKSALGDGRDLPGGDRDIDTDSLDLHQGFVEASTTLANGAVLSLTPGRQELSFGKQRLVSPLDWVNTRRSFDAVRASYRKEGLALDAFASTLVAVDRHDFNDGDSGQDFHGLYASTVLRPRLKAEAYALYLDRNRAVFGGSTNQEERITLGALLNTASADGAWDGNVEAAWQGGEFGGRDISAWMASAEAGWTATGAPGQPRLYGGLDMASGDDDPADGDVHTFNQLYPLGHAYFGFIDLVGRQNLMAANLGVSVKPVPSVTVRLDGHLFHKAEKADAWYNAGGGVTRPGRTADDELGREVDLLATWKANPRTTVLAGYSRFFAGDAASETPANEDVDFAYASVEWAF